MMNTAPTEPTVEITKRPLPVLEIMGIFMVLAAMILLIRELTVFKGQPQVLPSGSKVNDLPVDGLSIADAQAHLQQAYSAPITVYYDDQALTLDPAQVDFSVDVTQPFAQIHQSTSSVYLPEFWNFLWLRPESPLQVSVVPTFSQDKLKSWLQDIALKYDRAAADPGNVQVNTSAPSGQPGQHLNIDASLPVVEAALMSTTDRTAKLVIQGEAAPQADKPGLSTVQDQVVAYLNEHQFRGVMSFYLIDEKTGDELHTEMDFTKGSVQYLNCEVAYAGLSTMKIPIVVNYYKYLSWEPLPYEQDVIQKTLVESSNVLANYMLGEIGDQDQKRGAYSVTDSMKYLGLENTFIATPYDDTEEPEYFTTPAREAARTGQCANTNPDIYMQTTASDIAQLLDMVYLCAQAKGDLIAAYPNDLTPEECQEILDTMKQNVEGKLIRSGLPIGTPLAHKHGYTYDTISDSGIVFGPSGDYVLTLWIWEDVDWVATGAYPIMRDISSLIFSYFNPDLADEPRMGYGDLLDVPTNP